MKKYFNELNQEELRKVLEKNKLLFNELSQQIYEEKMYCQEEDAENMFGKNWYKYIDYNNHYSSFYLRVIDWEKFIDNLDKDYLTQEGIDLYNYIQDKREILNNMEWDTDNYYNLEEHLEKKSQELLDICENMLHKYENYPDFNECYYYLINGIYDSNNIEYCYINVDDKGNTDYILYQDIAYTKSFE